MNWLIQRGFDSDRYYLELISSLDRMGVAHTFCKVVPFSTAKEGLIIEDESILNSPIYCYGSYTLSKHVVGRGYKPGAFISNDSSLDNLLAHYGNYMLNSDMICGKLGSIIPKLDNFFIKPMEDTKAFTAEVMNKDTFNKFVENIYNVSKNGFSTITLDTNVIISSIKEINAEFRFFIVNGNVVTYSQYKIGDRVVYDPHVDEYIIKFAEKMVHLYEPDDAFVIDIAISNDELKVIEVNCINSSGLYAINLPKLINAIDCIDLNYVRNSIFC